MHLTNIDTPTHRNTSDSLHPDYTTMINILSTKTSDPTYICTMDDMNKTIQRKNMQHFRMCIEESQLDSGANKSVTNNTSILQNYTSITPIPTPTRGSENAASYDLHTLATTTMPPQGIALLDTGISIQFPPSTYVWKNCLSQWTCSQTQY